MQLNFASASKNKLKWILAIMAIHGCLAMGLTIGFIPDKTDQMDRSVYKHNEPWGTMQKSEVNKQTFRSRIRSRIGSRNTWEYIFLTSLNHQLFKNTAYDKVPEIVSQVPKSQVIPSNIRSDIRSRI